MGLVRSSGGTGVLVLSLFGLCISFSASLSAFSLPSWTRQLPVEDKEVELLYTPQDNENWEGITDLEIEEGEVLQDKKSHKWNIARPKIQVVRRKRKTHKPSAPARVVPLSSVTLDSLRSHMNRVEKQLGMDSGHPSKKAQEFAQGLVEAMKSIAEGNLRKRSGTETQLSFFKPYLCHCDTAKSFEKLLALSCALGDFFADRSKAKLPKEAQKIASSWKKLSYKEKGRKIGQFITRYYSA